MFPEWAEQKQLQEIKRQNEKIVRPLFPFRSSLLPSVSPSFINMLTESTNNQKWRNPCWPFTRNQYRFFHIVTMYLSLFPHVVIYSIIKWKLGELQSQFTSLTSFKHLEIKKVNRRFIATRNPIERLPSFPGFYSMCQTCWIRVWDDAPNCYLYLFIFKHPNKLFNLPKTDKLN